MDNSGYEKNLIEAVNKVKVCMNEMGKDGYSVDLTVYHLNQEIIGSGKPCIHHEIDLDISRGVR